MKRGIEKVINWFNFRTARFVLQSRLGRRRIPLVYNRLVSTDVICLQMFFVFYCIGALTEVFI